MAAGSGAASVRSRGSSAALESSLDRRFQGVTNTMESIQGLSTWCIENKKHHSVIVRQWMKWLRKSDASHRLNLFYLANDVIQNCKRKNAIVYRTAFADVLPEAFQLINNVQDGKVRRSVERILSIWEERNVYTGELITALRNGLEREPMEQEPPAAAPDNLKAALKSKIVAEFVPQAFIEHLSKHKASVEETELKEKQLAAMRVDVCSTETLKKLKDKAGGKRFSKDFEDGSRKLQEFVAFLEGQVRGGSPLLEALENADVFYEMQYKEVKIVANAYQTFANRVCHLKRKLDALKGTVPDPEDSPLPSPCEDAPSPTGSESPFHGLDHAPATPDPELDGLAMDEEEEGGAAGAELLLLLGDPPSPLSSAGGSPPRCAPLGDTDNRNIEDMELSDVEETEASAIIVEERVEPPAPVAVSNPAPEPAVTQHSLANQATPAMQASPPLATVAPVTPEAMPLAAASLPVTLASVDMGKITSILSTITNAMKNSGVSPGSRPSPGTPTTPSTPGVKSPPAAPLPSSPLANILSRVDFTPTSLLSALSKTQSHGLSSLLNNQAGKPALNPPASDQALPPNPAQPLHDHSPASPDAAPSPAAPPAGRSSAPPAAAAPPAPPPGNAQPRELPGAMAGVTKTEPSSSSSSSCPSAFSLERKIHSFLQGNPGLRGFNLGFPTELPFPAAGSASPSLGPEGRAGPGTPVRDESGAATPTQDEAMDAPGAGETFPYREGGAAKTAPEAAAPANPWAEPGPRGDARFGAAQNGGELRRIETLVSGPPPGNCHPPAERPDAAESLREIGRGGGRPHPHRAAGEAEGGWYGEAYADGRTVAAGEDTRRAPDSGRTPPAPNFFTSPLPPIPQLPPRPAASCPPRPARRPTLRAAASSSSSPSPSCPARARPGPAPRTRAPRTAPGRSASPCPRPSAGPARRPLRWATSAPPAPTPSTPTSTGPLGAPPPRRRTPAAPPPLCPTCAPPSTPPRPAARRTSQTTGRPPV